MAAPDLTYKGFTNYETWLITTTLSNVERFYAKARRIALSDWRGSSKEDLLETWVLNYGIIDWIEKINMKSVNLKKIVWTEVVEVIGET